MTITRDWGWVFIYNNGKYYRTRHPNDAWIGQGPLFFNRTTGEIREFGSGCNFKDEIYDYEMELKADGDTWCLWLSNENNRQEAILRLRSLLRVEISSAQKMVKCLPVELFHGIRRHLDWMQDQLSHQGIQSFILLQSDRPNCQEFKIPHRFEGMCNVRAHHAFHDRWQPDW